MHITKIGRFIKYIKGKKEMPPQQFLKESEKENFHKVANIQFGFANGELIDKLRERGRLLWSEKMTALNEIEG